MVEPFTVCGLVAGTVGTLNIAEQRIKRLIKQWRDMEEVPKQYSKFVEALEETRKDLQNNSPSATTNIELQDKERFEKCLEEFNEEMEKVEIVMKSSRVRQFWSAKDIKGQLDNLMQKLYEQNNEMRLSNRFAHMRRYLETVIREVFVSGKESEEKFSPKKYVAPPSTNIVLDLEDLSTNEGVLKSKVLPSDTTEGIEEGRLVVAYGMNGVGKTCA